MSSLVFSLILIYITSLKLLATISTPHSNFHIVLDLIHYIYDNQWNFYCSSKFLSRSIVLVSKSIMSAPSPMLAVIFFKKKANIKCNRNKYSSSAIFFKIGLLSLMKIIIKHNIFVSLSSLICERTHSTPKAQGKCHGHGASILPSLIKDPATIVRHFNSSLSLSLRLCQNKKSLIHQLIPPTFPPAASQPC